MRLAVSAYVQVGNIPPFSCRVPRVWWIKSNVDVEGGWRRDFLALLFSRRHRASITFAYYPLWVQMYARVPHPLVFKGAVFDFSAARVFSSYVILCGAFTGAAIFISLPSVVTGGGGILGRLARGTVL